MKLVLHAHFEVELPSENHAVAIRIHDSFKRKIQEFRDAYDPLIADGKSEPYRIGVLKMHYQLLEGEFE